MENGKPLAAGIPTLGEIFRAAGYRTAYAGKWHLPKSFDGMTSFDKIAGGSALGAKMDAPVADACSAWLRQQEGGPFLLVASFMNPHDICDWIRAHPGARSHASVKGWPPAPANMAAEPGEPDCVRFHRTAGYDQMSQAVGIASQWRVPDFRQYLHDYYRLVEQVDHHVGTVLAALRDSPHAKNTIVCLTSDHGEGLGAHRWVQKASFYEESVRVPLMFAGPGIPAGRTCDSLASLPDILPAFCDYAGVPVPGDVRGQSLKPAMEGAALPRTMLASELRYGSPQKEGRMIRSARYKYVRFNWGERREQLFDLDLDPGETVNLAAAPEASAVLEEHRRMLRSWQRETRDNSSD